MSNMTDNKPYLLRALHEWISDNGCTPYLYVNTQVAGVSVPAHLMDESPLVLSASYNACRGLALENTAVSFQARFGGNVHDVYLPIDSIIAIVARENGQGMTFEWDEQALADDAEDGISESDDTENANDDATSDDKPRRGGLRVIR
ncbi:MAG: ClpXP protease specificity-enhancing factor [Gammaproteobacteria bacterium]|nr:MAG: ClpXP protease specificity-enhancing factor [Gammaproteobacteria bacterium]